MKEDYVQWLFGGRGALHISITSFKYYYWLCYLLYLHTTLGIGDTSISLPHETFGLAIVGGKLEGRGSVGP